MERAVQRKRSAETGSRLQASAWVVRALEVLAERGIEGVRVELLAKQLKVTKGSFYWHFGDRSALLTAMLDEWRRRATLAVINRFESTHEPAPKRLARLLRLQFDAKHAEIGAETELSMRLWGRHDPRAAQVLQEIDALRLSYIRKLIEESGVKPEIARARAVLAYCYMRVSRSLLEQNLDRATTEMCEQLLSAKE